VLALKLIEQTLLAVEAAFAAVGNPFEPFGHDQGLAGENPQQALAKELAAGLVQAWTETVKKLSQVTKPIATSSIPA
jgi:hypothetical protein